MNILFKLLSMIPLGITYVYVVKLLVSMEPVYDYPTYNVISQVVIATVLCISLLRLHNGLCKLFNIK